MPETILGVVVDPVLTAELIKFRSSAGGLMSLSDPRNDRDTTDEWLMTFYDHYECCIRILELLGDQTDLLSRTVRTPTMEEE